jgi:type II secretory pathway component PulF
MPSFNYVARNQTGTLTHGIVVAVDRTAAIQQIEQLHCFPVKVEQAQSVDPAAASTNIKDPALAGILAFDGATLKIPLAHLFLFTEQLAHLLTAGMTLDEALAILVRRLQDPKLQGLAKALHQALIDGRSFSLALRDFPKIFSPLYVNMVSAGEASGALPQILKRLVTHLAGVKALRDRVQQALVYPAVLVGAGIVLIFVFITVMVPQLTEFFTSTGQKLPAATQLLLHANDAITHYWWLGALACAGIFSGWKTATSTQEGRKAWDHFTWNIPGFSRITRYRFYAQFSRTLSTLIENGVSLLKSLELLEQISGNEWVRLQIVEARQTVINGKCLSSALRQQTGLFPDLFLDMMAVGEQTGRFAETMQMIADMHERELDKQVQFVSSIIPPVIIVIIAAVVGVVVYGILSAVFNLTSGLHTR